MSTETQHPQLNSDQEVVCSGLIAQILDHCAEVAELREKYRTLQVPRLAVLIGPAGTGKTFTIAELVIRLSEQGINTLVVAPTNRAVAIIQQKISDQAAGRVLSATFRSLHSALGMRMTENDDGTQSVTTVGDSILHNYDLVICDEGSMVGNFLLNVIKAEAGNAFVLGVGDDCQLLPVDSGNSKSQFFAAPHPDLIWSLSKPERYSGDLAAAAGWMRDHIHDSDRIDPLDILARLPGARIRGSKQMIEELLKHRRAGHDARALCYRNATVLDINETVHEELYGAKSERFCEGEPVIVQEGCDGLNLATGDDYTLVTSEECVIEQVTKGRHPLYPTEEIYALVLLTRTGKRVEVFTPVNHELHKRRVSLEFKRVAGIKTERDTLGRSHRDYDKLSADYKADLRATWDFVKAFANIRHAYAMTTHKSQGGTFDYAYLFLDDMAGYKSAALYNTAMYTALTRPRYAAYLCFGR